MPVTRATIAKRNATRLKNKRKAARALSASRTSSTKTRKPAARRRKAT